MGWSWAFDQFILFFVTRNYAEISLRDFATYHFAPSHSGYGKGQQDSPASGATPPPLPLYTPDACQVKGILIVVFAGVLTWGRLTLTQHANQK
jgi:hypothetical protein